VQDKFAPFRKVAMLMAHYHGHLSTLRECRRLLRIVLLLLVGASEAFAWIRPYSCKETVGQYERLWFEHSTRESDCGHCNQFHAAHRRSKDYGSKAITWQPFRVRVAMGGTDKDPWKLVIPKLLYQNLCQAFATDVFSNYGNNPCGWSSQMCSQTRGIQIDCKVYNAEGWTLSELCIRTGATSNKKDWLLLNTVSLQFSYSCCKAVC